MKRFSAVAVGDFVAKKSPSNNVVVDVCVAQVIA
jgi:hypothetical protein